MFEKREWRRAVVDLPVLFEFPGVASVCARAIDMNSEGFRVKIPGAFDVGMRGPARLDLAPGVAAVLLIQVMWSGFSGNEQGYQAGVRIVGGDEAEREKFLRFYNLKVVLGR
ncbi:MAG: PilZ domain-containing protein [Candidatus Omnitrophica bacterium]|nr:PilZ domain-containing protein [Candidatus Omnitrophota bacterium]